MKSQPDICSFIFLDKSLASRAIMRGIWDCNLARTDSFLLILSSAREDNTHIPHIRNADIVNENRLDLC